MVVTDRLASDRDACEGLSSVFALLGKRWSGVIVGTLLDGPARFSEIARRVSGVSERVLSGRLAELVHAGLVEREVEEGPPVVVRYRLTDCGEGLRPGLAELERWAAEHFEHAARPPATRTGRPVQPGPPTRQAMSRLTTGRPGRR